MTRWFFPCLYLLLTLTHAQAQPQVFMGARLIPIVGEPIDNGVLLVQDGKIHYAGTAEAASLPANAVRHDVSGKVIMPGLVDTHSHLGRVDGGDASAALHPDVRVLDAVDVQHSGIKKALAGGRHAVSGQPAGRAAMIRYLIAPRIPPGAKLLLFAFGLWALLREHWGFVGVLGVSLGLVPIDGWRVCSEQSM